MNLKFEISNFRAAWWWLRQVSGDAAYESYVRSHQRKHGCRDTAPLSREEFYLDTLRRRYSGVSRCC
jgi:uncharacterized short protein YbdD (DUF466 family)